MIDEPEIRKGLASDTASIEALYPSAFPDEDLLPLVRDLLKEESIVLSLVGIAGEALIGHVMVTTCGIAGSGDKVALLGPLAIAPAWQRRGIGGALVRAGLRAMEGAAAARVLVLGDPAYYGRFGFRPETGITPPYPLPEEWRGAWQSLSPGGDDRPLHGTLSVPKPWRNPALWSA